MAKQQRKGSLLAADVGGTKTSLALHDSDHGLLNPLAEKTVSNDDADSFEDIIADFLQENDNRPQTACFGVAGPVIDNRVRMTNLDWSLDASALRQRFKMESVLLINDLVATAMGAVQLPENSLFTLNKGRQDPKGAIAVIAPGTGLGQAFLVKDGDRMLPFPSEGGHSSFAPVNEQQTRLLSYMLARQDHVSAEKVCSGMGLPHLYEFILTEDQGTQPSQKIRQAADPTRAIVEAALAVIEGRDSDDGTAVKTVEFFIALLASESANLVLKVLARGGLFIGGGLPPRILAFLKDNRFMNAFCKGIYKDMLADIPVHVILEPKTALIGAAAYGLSGFGHQEDRQ